MRVAVLGTGIMGSGMARSLLRSGLDVTVWNRTPSRAAPLAADGAHVAGTSAETVADADAVITILWDGNSVAEVMADALPAAPRRSPPTARPWRARPPRRWPTRTW